jgi:SAM-dependent methyltransferase
LASASTRDQAAWRLNEHRETWHEKPALARIYGVWFEALLDTIAGAQHVLEVGAGPGFLAPFARGRISFGRWISSDYIPLPWNDLAADAQRLPFRAATHDAIVGVDILHHLAAPREFFAEAARVLRPRGRMALVEPWVSPFSYLIYRFLHHESCQMGLDPWRPFPEARAAKDVLDGNAAALRTLVGQVATERWYDLGFSAPEVTRWNCFAYLASLGFRRSSPLGPIVPTPLLWFDRLTRVTAPVLGLRAIAVWTRLER